MEGNEGVGNPLLWPQTVPEPLLGEQAHANFVTLFSLGSFIPSTDIH